MMISRSNAVLLFILLLIQSYSPSLAFQMIPINSSPSQVATASVARQPCLSSLVASDITRRTSTGLLYSNVFDMPSREMEDEETEEDDEEILNKNTNQNNNNKFRLSNIIRQGRGHISASPKKKEMMTQVHSLEEYKTHVADVKDALVVVFFTAPWCRTCQRLKPKMRAMATGFKESNDVRLVEIPLLNKNSAALFQGLGVQSFPFAHIYHPTEGLVEELKLNRKVWSEFQTTLREYRDGHCEVQYNNDGTIRQELRKQLLEAEDGEEDS